MNESEFISKYIDDNVPKFNPELFKRDDYEIIEELKKVILSCQREYPFTIKVKGFAVIEDYDKIIKILADYNNRFRRDKFKEEDIYNFIQMNDSSIRLLLVRYYVSTKNVNNGEGSKIKKDRKGNPIKEEAEFTTTIIVPRYVDKYYFKVMGVTYLAINQIMDASTYNNSQANKKKDHNVTFKGEFMSCPIYRFKVNMKTTEAEDVSMAYFISSAFNKRILVHKYLLAKFGFFKMLDFLGLTGMIHITKEDIMDHKIYHTFTKKGMFFISVPRVLYDKNEYIQSIIYTLLDCTNKNTTVDDIITKEYFLILLGKDYCNASVEKGYSVLMSLEGIYGIIVREDLRLPVDKKQTIYHILAWLVGEFNRLRLKNNLDISTKSVRISSYIAFLYANKLSNGIHNISSRGRKVTVSIIKKFINNSPDYLIKQLIRCRLVNSNNLISDNDATAALKFSYKGVSGIGKKKETISDIYRHCHPSHLGRVSLTTSSDGDPGMSGILCPRTELYDKHFSEFEEPNLWDKELNEQIDNFKQLVGQQEILQFKESLGFEVESTEKELLNAVVDISKDLFIPVEQLVNEMVESKIESKEKEIDPNELLCFFNVSMEVKLLNERYEL